MTTVARRAAKLVLPLIVIWSAFEAAQTGMHREWLGWDLTVYLEAGRRLAAGLDPYAFSMPPVGGLFRYSPMFAVLMAPLSSLPFDAVALSWRLVELVLLTLSVRGLGWLGALIIINPLVFMDLSVANVSTISLAAMIAVVRWPSARTIVAYALLAIIIPKPTLLPVLAWGLWRVPSARIPAGVVLALGAASLALPGYAAALLSGGHVFGMMQNIHFVPAPVVWAALVAAVGVTVASLRWPRLLGLAVLLATPYYLDYVWMLGLLALVPPGLVPGRSAAPADTERDAAA